MIRLFLLISLCKITQNAISQTVSKNKDTSSLHTFIILDEYFILSTSRHYEIDDSPCYLEIIGKDIEFMARMRNEYIFLQGTMCNLQQEYIDYTTFNF